MKTEFLNNEIWLLTFGGAFQRASIYSKNVSIKDRIDFKRKIRKNVEAIICDQYKSTVREKDHLENIRVVQDFSKELVSLNFGISQKLLNLYLKYNWCLEKVITPPHFPVDRVIQLKLNKKARELNIPLQPVKPWTRFEDSADYLKVIDFARKIKKRDPSLKNLSLAELELKLYNRR